MAAQIITVVPSGPAQVGPEGPIRKPKARADAKVGSKAYVRKLERNRERFRQARTCADCSETFIGSAEAKRCPACRQKRFLASNAARRKYVWTPELDAILRDRYAVDGPRRLAGRLSIHQRAVQERATVLGLTRAADRRNWTPNEVAYLEDHAGTLTVRTLARHLKRRPTSVALKLRSLKISAAVRDGNTADSLAQCFGVTAMTIAAWIKRGLFGKVERRDGDVENSPFNVTDAQVLAFIRNNPTSFQLARVDQVWFLDLVFNSRAHGNGKHP